MRGASLLLKSRTGAASLEFALISLPFLGLLLGTMSVALNLYLQFALDYALQQAVRQVQLGHVPASTSAGDFVGSVFCPVFVQFAQCAGLVASIQPVSDYSASSVAGSAAPQTVFCVGGPGQLMYSRITYQAPLLSGIYTTLINGSWPGTNGNTIVATAAFANENPSGTPATGSPGC